MEAGKQIVLFGTTWTSLYNLADMFRYHFDAQIEMLDNAAALLERLTQTVPDLLVLDVHHDPRLLDSIRHHWQNTPVLALCISRWTEGQTAQPDAVLYAPMEPEEVLAAARRLL